MYHLQRMYISLLNPLYDKIGMRIEPWRNYGILVIAFISSGYFLVSYSGSLPSILQSETERSIFGAILLLFLIIFSQDRRLEPVKWNRLFVTIYYLIGAAIFLAACLHPIGKGYLAFSLMMLFLYPCLYLIWNNRGDHAVLYDCFAMAAVVTGVGYFLLSLILAFQGHGFEPYVRYQSTTINPNLLGMIGAAVFGASLYCFNKVKSLLMLLFAFGAGAGAALVLFSQSRCSFLACLFVFIFWLWFSLKDNFYEKTIKAHLRKMIILFAILVLVIVGGYEMMKLGDSSGMTVPKNSGTQQDFVAGADDVLQRFQVDAKDGNAFSSGRIAIWKKFLLDLNWTGHDYNTFKITEFTGGARYAHNNPLEFAHRCGIPTGLLYLFMEILAGVYILRVLFSKEKQESYQLYVLVVITMFGVFSMLDVETLPFTRDACFSFFLVLAPLFQKYETKSRTYLHNSV